MAEVPWPSPSLGPFNRKQSWIVATILALLFHLLLLLPKFPGLLLPEVQKKPQIKIQNVDPRKLEEMRRKWRDSEKQLLLNKNSSQPNAAEPPPDARYMSDRNIRVDKETRAREHVVLPKQGAPGPKAAPQPRETQAPKPKVKGRALPKLGNLGLPLPAPSTGSQAQAPTQPRRPVARSGDEGGHQYIKDPKALEGSENILNAQESVFYSFYARLYEAIGPIWQSKIREGAFRRGKLAAGNYTTQLDVVFDKQGNLVGIRQLQGSGIPEFDQAATLSWKQIGRFPNPPTGLLNEQEQVHTGWTFTVQVNQGMNFESLPPERVY